MSNEASENGNLLRVAAEEISDFGFRIRIGPSAFLAFATSSIGSLKSNPNDFRVPARQRKGDIARATANVQRPVTWLHARQFDAPALHRRCNRSSERRLIKS